eukprot:6471229-Amphidinium_carterae.2
MECGQVRWRPCGPRLWLVPPSSMMRSSGVLYNDYYIFVDVFLASVLSVVLLVVTQVLCPALSGNVNSNGMQWCEEGRTHDVAAVRPPNEFGNSERLEQTAHKSASCA